MHESSDQSLGTRLEDEINRLEMQKDEQQKRVILAQKKGAEDLNKFLKTFALVLHYIYQNDESFYGQLPEIKHISKPAMQEIKEETDVDTLRRKWKEEMKNASKAGEGEP